MSIHSIVRSNITDLNSLTRVLTASGVPWEPYQAIDKATGEVCANAVSAVIGGERVLIWQENEGEAFRFQSAGWTFRNRDAIQSVAVHVSPEQRLRQQRAAEENQRQEAERRRARAEWQRAERERQLARAEQQRAESERQRAEAERQRLQAEGKAREQRQRELDRQRLEADQRRLAGERQRVLEEQRRREAEERVRREEEDRQRRIAAEAAEALARLDSTRPAPESRPALPPVTPRPAAPDPGPVEATAAPDQAAGKRLEELIGRMHQGHARQQILEHVEELRETYGLSLESEDALEDGTIELHLRG